MPDKKWSNEKPVILTPLKIIRRRLRNQRLLDGTLCSLFICSMIAAAVMLCRIFIPLPGTAAGDFALLVIAGLIYGPLIGLFLLPADSNESARKTDERYQLKDRLLTACELLKRKSLQPIEQLQLADAAVYAEKIEPSVVVPYKIPKPFKGTLCFFFAAFILAVLPPFQEPGRSVSRSEPVLEPEIFAAQILEEDIVKDIEILAEKNPDERTVKELSRKMKEYVKQLETVKNNRKETLAAVSEMEEELRKAIRELLPGAGEKTMNKIGEALTAAKPTQQAGQALKEGRFAEAKQQLKKFDGKSVNSMTAKERETVTKMMEDIVKGMEESGQKSGQKSLQDAAQKFGDAMTENDSEKAKDAAAELAEESGKQALRQEIAEGLEGKLSMLGLNKAEINTAGTPSDTLGDGTNDGGNNTQKSGQESKNWGSGAAGNPNAGQETRLEGKREQQNVSGSMTGEGESEYEKFRSQEVSKEQTSRQFRESFQEYRKMSEQVLESEPLPLGQRQTIRRYFKAIEPKEEETAVPVSGAAK